MNSLLPLYMCLPHKRGTGNAIHCKHKVIVRLRTCTCNINTAYFHSTACLATSLISNTDGHVVSSKKWLCKHLYKYLMHVPQGILGSKSSLFTKWCYKSQQGTNIKIKYFNLFFLFPVCYWMPANFTLPFTDQKLIIRTKSVWYNLVLDLKIGIDVYGGVHVSM